MTCKDCIHAKVCDNLISQGLPWEDGKYPAEKWCDLFKNKADVVEVVRCKDCKHCTLTEEGEHARDDIVCEYFMTDGMLDNDYCSYGERRENGD